MKQSMGLYSFLGFAVTSLGGTILHFLYDWLGKAAGIAPFSGVNESTWEHMKLLFWPMLTYAVVQSLFVKDSKEFWCIKLRSILLGQILIPVIFYTYNGAIGKSPDWLNISIFFVCAAIAYICEARLFKKERLRCVSPKIAVALLCLIALCFIVFTFLTPPINLFKDPISGGYGIA